MKKLVAFVTLALSVVVLILLTTSTPITAQQAGSSYQRYITFHNDFDFPIYPVIQVPANICDSDENSPESKGVRRILINGPGQSHNGLQKNETVTVLIPNEMQSVTVNGAQQVHRCWYQSGRIYIFPVSVDQFEQNMVQVDPSNVSQQTIYDDKKYPKVSVSCFEEPKHTLNGNCYTGFAQNSFAADVPAQLAEYTFDSDNGDANGDPDTGIAMADIDVSHVDDLYLPVAASVVNNGATGYMGGAMPLSQFQQRLSNFFTNVSWPKYSAYLSQNQPSATIRNAIDTKLLPPDLGGGKNTPAPHLPAGFNSIQNTLAKAASSVYKINNSTSNYLISGVLNQSTQVQPYIDRWTWWINQNGQPCSSNVMSQLIWPDGITASFDKQDFCNQFSATVNDVWTHFLTDPTDGFQNHQWDFYSDCGLYDKNHPDIPPPNDPNLKNACIIQHIIGYNSQVEGGVLPGQVQALLRSVAYNSADGVDPKNKQYQYDPFLTFAAPYNSQFNLDPYTRLIHSTKDGVGAVAYSFSIDDKYGNFRDASLGILIDAGGTSALDNQQPYDPYQQYSMNWGYNRDKFSLLSVASGVNLADTKIQSQLKQIAAQNDNRPYLIKQDQNIVVLGHDTGTNWKLTTPLITQAQLQIQAQQEEARGKTQYYRTLLNYLFGSSQITSIFPNSVWDGSSPNPTIALLDFDAGVQDTSWAVGQSLLYNYISRQNADIPAKGNWVSADASQCGIPNSIAINGPGSQRFPVKLNQPCQVILTNSFQEKMVFSLTPISKQVTDNYTGTQVTVMSLPVGSQTSGNPPTSSNLTAADLKFCQDNSSTGRMTGYCNNINVSAVWSGDRFSRDVVYMGLAFEDMPRVNVNLPNAPPNPPDPTAVNWPTNAAVTFQVANGQIAQVNWPAAVTGANQKLQYTLYLLTGHDNNGNQIWTPQLCNPPNIPTSATVCKVNLNQPASVYVLAQNVSASPPTQSPTLYGCHPTANVCPPAATGKPTKTRTLKR